MKQSARTGVWIYAAGAAVAALLSLAGFFHAPSPFPLGFHELSHAAMVGVIVFGLVLIPQLARSESERDALTTKAAKLEVEASTDPLTGLYNRRYFEQALAEYLVAFQQAGAPLGLLTLDLDHFKSVNDNYGHDAGDVVLQELAQLLKGLTREHDIVARTGGEEFAVLAPFARADQIRPFAERLCRMVANMRIDLGDVVLRPTVSIGLATTLDGVRDAKELIKLSDERLYMAKEQGRNRVCSSSLVPA